VGVAGRRFLGTLIGRLASEQAAEPAQDGPQHRRTQPSWPGAEVRTVAWSLVRQQGCMLAQIENELIAPDRAGGRVRRRRVWLFLLLLLLLLLFCLLIRLLELYYSNSTKARLARLYVHE
jgi:hypothetical protein